MYQVFEYGHDFPLKKPLSISNQVEGKCIFSSNLLRPLGVQNKDVYICTALQIYLCLQHRQLIPKNSQKAEDLFQKGHFYL